MRRRRRCSEWLKRRSARIRRENLEGVMVDVDCVFERCNVRGDTGAPQRYPSAVMLRGEGREEALRVILWDRFATRSASG